MKMLNVTSMVVLSFVLITGCTKKRDDRCNQGQCRNLEVVEAFDGKMYSVHTKEAIAGTSGTTSSSFKIEINNKAANSLSEKSSNKSGDKNRLGIADMNNIFSLVDYETEAKLMPKGLEFRGRANTKDAYHVLYRVTDNYLKVMKVAFKKDIPWEELPFIEEELEDGRVAVPLVGYPIQHMILEKAKNNDNEDTNIIIEIPVQTKEESQKFKINLSQYERFEALTLNETFPTSLFGFGSNSKPELAEEWYFLETVIEGSEVFENYTGLVFNKDSENSQASRVIFKPDGESRIQVRNAHVAEQYQNREDRGDADQAWIMDIPAEFFDLRLRPNGSESSVTPEKYFGQKYEDREFVQLNLAGVQSRFITSGYKSELVEINIEDGYFSFVVSTEGERIVGYNPYLRQPITEEFRGKIRYSFYKVNQRKIDKLANGCAEQYSPRVAFSDDFEHFGMFTTQEKFVLNSDIRSRKDLEKKYHVSRHDPSCPVVYHVGEKTKKKYLPHAKKMIETWGQTLRSNGVNFQVKFDEQPVRTGDVRYNTIDIVESEYQGGWAGIAQTVTDSDTGEVIYSQAQIQAGEVKAMVQRQVIRFLREKIGASDVGFSETSVHFSAFSPVQQAEMSYLSQLAVNDYIPGIIYDPKANPWEFSGELYQMAASRVPISERKNPAFILLNKDVMADRLGYRPTQTQGLAKELSFAGSQVTHRCSIQEARGMIKAQIDSFCNVGDQGKGIPSLFEYISSLSGKEIDPEMELNNDVINHCVKNLVESPESPVIAGIGLHEVGHTLALRHNFKASADKDNYYTKDDKVDELSANINSSSVMDYANTKDLWLPIPGKYDIAAIRFIYDDEVIKRGSRQAVKVDTSMSLDDQGLDKQMKKYMFCSDEQAYTYADPYCRPQDYGSTPLEIVESTIEDYKESLKNRRLRFDNYKSGGIDVYTGYFLPILRVYQEWRYELRKYVGSNNQYLHEYSEADEYLKMLEELADKSAGFKAVYNKYFAAANKAHDFLLNTVAFMPNRYCVFGKKVGDDVQDAKIVELNKIRHFADYQSSVISCKSPAVKKYALAHPEQFSGLEMLEDLGYETWDAFFDRSLFKYSGGSGEIAPVGFPDVVGTVRDRINAFAAIGFRFPLHPIGRHEGFAPTMMDEPHLRKKTQEKIVERIVHGVKLPTFKGNGYFANFYFEQPLLEEMYNMFRDSIQVQGKAGPSSDRQLPFDVWTMSPGSDPTQIAIAYTKFGTLYLAAMDPNSSVAIQLLHKVQLNELFLSNTQELGDLTKEKQLEIYGAINEVETASKKDGGLKLIDLKNFNDAMTGLKKKYPGVKGVLNIAFKNEEAILPIVAQGLSQMRGKPPTGNESLSAVVDGVSGVLAKKIAAFNHAHLADRFYNVANSYIWGKDNYLQNASEVDAQKDLIKNVLVRRSYYMD